MNKRSTLAFTLAITLPFIGSAQAGSWGYSSENGPEHWGHVSTTCSEGKNQSPVDIRSTQLVDAQLQPLEFHYQGKVANVVNNGHTVQVNITGDNTLTLDGQVFELKQFHFHTPSENTFNGKHAPLEAHFVHANVNGELAVVAVMFKSGEREDSVLAEILHTLPAADQTIDIKSDLALANLLPRVKTYYRYNGSLTTPPCSEGVRWIVLTDPQFIIQGQLENLSKTMGHNARPTQDLNARLLLK